MAETEQTNVEIDGPQPGLVDMQVALAHTNRRIQDAQISLANEILAAIQNGKLSASHIVAGRYLVSAIPGPRGGVNILTADEIEPAPNGELH